MTHDLKVFGFWIYLMTDLIIFAVLFATFLVLRGNTFGGPTASELFHMLPVFMETVVLLTSSFTCSLATLAIHRGLNKSAIEGIAKPHSAPNFALEASYATPSILWFGITFLLGITFLVLELNEFSQLIAMGAGPQRSGFLSSFFTLVGTHGFHIAIGLLWMLAAIFRLWLRPLTAHSASQMIRLAFFWHFLDVVWIFIFSVVYGMGHLS